MHKFLILCVTCLLAALPATAPALAGGVTLDLRLEASVTPGNAVVVTVTNDAKEGDRSFDTVEVLLGGTADAPACRMVLPAVTVPAGFKRTVEVAGKATLKRCMGWPVTVTLERLRRRLVLTEIETSLRAPAFDQRDDLPAVVADRTAVTDSGLVRVIGRTKDREGRVSEAAMSLELH